MPCMYTDIVFGSKAPLMYSDTALGAMLRGGESHVELPSDNRELRDEP